MAFSAGRGHVELVDRRRGIVRRKNLVRPMAIRADGRTLRTSLHRFAMHAVLIGCEHLGADAATIHHELLSVAAAAGRGNIGVIHRRLGIARRQNIVGIPVAIHTRRRRRSIDLFLLSMKTMLIRFRRIRVASHACDFFRLRRMRRFRDVFMAIHAAEHGSVDRSLHLDRIDVQADLLAAHVLGQRRVGVAGQTIRVLRLLCRL